MATIIRLNQSITNNDAPRLSEIITSDDFSGTGELVGSMTSAALGGEPMQWKGVAGGWTRHEGGIHTPQGSYAQHLELYGLPADISVSYKVVSLPDSGFLSVSVRTQDSNNREVFGLTDKAELWIENRLEGVTTRSKIVGGVEVGDILTFTADGVNLTSAVNGVPVLTYEAQITAPGWMRLSTYPVINATIDDLIVEKF